jgi:hypothetical protein
MEKKDNPNTENGFSNKFFDDLAKEYDKIDNLANQQKELKQKHNQSVQQ